MFILFAFNSFIILHSLGMKIMETVLTVIAKYYIYLLLRATDVKFSMSPC